MMKLKNLILIAFFSICLSACSVLDWMVYKIDIPQGNFIEEKQVAQLRIAMSKEQVKYILGSPMLVDAFEPDTWYYMYHYQEGNGDRTLDKKELTLHFENNQLLAMQGDFQPSPEFNTPLDGFTPLQAQVSEQSAIKEAEPKPLAESKSREEELDASSKQPVAQEDSKKQAKEQVTEAEKVPAQESAAQASSEQKATAKPLASKSSSQAAAKEKVKTKPQTQQGNDSKEAEQKQQARESQESSSS